MITQILSFAGGPTGPFARFLARDCAAILALNPGERVSSDLSGRTRLRLLPSGVFFPTVENLLPAETRFSLEDWTRDSRALSAKGYGPVKLRLDPACVPASDRETVAAFLAPVEPKDWAQAGDLLIEGEDACGLVPERVICAVTADSLADPALPGFLAARHVTHLALFGAENLPADPPRPLWAWTEKSAPMKVRLAHEA